MDESLIFDRYYNLALRFLSYRPRSEKEVYDYLKEKARRKPSLTEQVIAKIMQRLIELNFINDLEFAHFWIERRRKVLRVIRAELSQKGISKDIIEKAVLSFDMSRKEEDLLERLIAKKTKALSTYSDKQRYEKLVNFLLRQGFDYETVRKTLKNKENEVDAE